MKRTLRSGNRGFKVIAYILCIILSVLSLMPFVIMVINSTRSTYEIQQNAISLIPSTYLKSNFAVYDGKTFDAWKGFGGIRNEEDYLITEDGARRLGNHKPSSADEIEAECNR